jgi:hypothetical protein
MNDQELRALIRATVARHLGLRASASAPPTRTADPALGRDHASHDVYMTVVNVTGACVIEPDVPCEHCNYCKSHGY